MLTGETLSRTIKEILREDGIKCAVAFWGDGAEHLISKDSLMTARIVCNLKTGGTNPSVIERLQAAGAAVQQHDKLHAKVYIGGNKALVASANASINGLGLQGREQAVWLEAGSFVDSEAASAWFEEIWSDSRLILPEDIENARPLFEAHRQTRPTQDLLSYASGVETMPLMDWSGNHEGKDDLDVAEELFGGNRDVLQRRLENGIEVTGPEDEEIKRGTWCLKYGVKRKGDALKSVHDVSWTCLAGPDAIAEDIRTYPDGDEPEAKKSMMLELETSPPHPFDIDMKFKEILQEVLVMPAFKDITPREWEGSFFSEKRKELIQKAWKEILRRYALKTK